INSLASGLADDDLDAVAVRELDAVLLPMASCPADVEYVAQLLERFENERAREDPIRIFPLIETALGIINAYQILSSSPRVAGAMFGPGDYTLDIGTKMTVEGLEVLYARSHVVTATRAAGLPGPIDGPFTRIDDLEGYESNARTGKLLGYGGKTVLHPAQLPICHQVFNVSQEDLAWARRVDEAFQEAEAEGIASIKLSDGEFVDYPIVYRARRLLQEAKDEAS
ncbi:MAG: CoA ester lyase, partial [Actinomycetota bacterium]|nr:CoA ester lyase [Actinomycetota bacterium]